MRSLLFASLLLASCGPSEPDADAGSDAATTPCELAEFEVGDPEGHADPLGVRPGEARAGRVSTDDLPDFPSGLQVWEGGDFVLANEHVAMVIEDAGQSELLTAEDGELEAEFDTEDEFSEGEEELFDNSDRENPEDEADTEDAE